MTIALAACGEKQEPDPGAPPAANAATGQQQSGQFDPTDVLGTWRGKLRQKGLEEFEVTATIRSLAGAGRNPVRYTGIDCAGNWTFEGFENGEFRFREVIERGEGGKCKGVGTVTLTPTAGGRLDYVFEGGGVTSRGVLARAG